MAPSTQLPTPVLPSTPLSPPAAANMSSMKERYGQLLGRLKSALGGKPSGGYAHLDALDQPLMEGGGSGE